MVKLLRTDTTLDLSQKARVVRNLETRGRGFYKTGSRTDHQLYLRVFAQFSQYTVGTRSFTLNHVAILSTVLIAKVIKIYAENIY